MARATFRPTSDAVFPETKFMGSKRKLLPYILDAVSSLKPVAVLDAFSGSGCVAHALKRTGRVVSANDMLRFCHHITSATVANSCERLDPDAVDLLLAPAPRADTFIRDTFRGLYFSDSDNEFLDNIRYRIIHDVRSEALRSLAYASVARACIQKRPRGLFTFTGLTKGDDGRRDHRVPLREHFLRALADYSIAIFDSGASCRSFNLDVFSLPRDLADVVYVDPPYVGPYSDCDYTRRYHFVEGFCRGWLDYPPDLSTTTKKIKSIPTAFSRPSGAVQAFARLFDHFGNARFVLSYSSNSVPEKDEMVSLLKKSGRRVTVLEYPHRYHHGNHGHLKDRSRSNVVEYLFIAK